MPAKYYIYASGRWCEVETRRGRVEGSRQRARFCFLRGGRLEVARTAPVLRALRALAIGSGGAARDAAPLPRSRPRRWWKDKDSAVGHVCCSHHPHNSRCDLNANELAEKPPLQTITLSTASSPRKRKRSSTEDLPSKQGKSEASKTKDILSESKPRARGLEEQRIVQSLLQSSSEDTDKGQSKEKNKSSPQKSTKESQKLKGSETRRIVRSLLQSSSDTEPEQKPPLTQHKQPRIKSTKDDVKKTTPQALKKIRSAEEEKLVQSLLQSSSSEDVADLPSSRPQTARRSKPPLASDSSSSDEEARPCKELIIEDSVVMIMRSYLAENVGWDAVERFDFDDGYKTRLFYKLNPVVSLKRCPEMEKLLKQRQSLSEFARHLGLRSVADVTPEKRYRMRHSTRQARHTASESETEKENNVQPKRRQLWNRDKLAFNSFRSSRSSDVRGKPQIPKPSRDSSPDNVDSDAEIKKHIRRHLERRASARLNPERKETKKKDDDSIIVSDDDSISNTDENKKTRAKVAEKPDESVIVSDDSGGNRKYRRTRVRKAEENESVLVSDDSDDDKKKSKTRATSKTDDNNESLVVSDSDSSDNTDGSRKSPRRTRSQGPEKRVLRERNKSVVICDDSDGKTGNSENSNSKSKTQRKSVSDESNRNEHQAQHSRTRSRDVEIELKENSEKRKKDNGNKNGTTESTRKTRSSINGVDNVTTKNKTENKKEQGSKTESSKKGEKHVLNKSVTKDYNKAAKGQDTSAKSDTDDDEAFDESPKKNTQRPSFGDLIRNVKGRFQKRSKLKGKQQNTDKKASKNDDKQISEDETDEETNKTEDTTKKYSKKRDISSQRHKKATDEEVRDKTNEKNRIGKRNNETRGENDEQEQKNDGKNKKDRRENKNEDKNEMQSASTFRKPLKFKKSCVANGREYTSLEDHAIVAWVSAGRERMVNGNAVWRELQQQYTRLTSQTRSWHSLRNRYLRYILPSLASLSLPQSQISRLRAAAATGSIKSRGRRNSIYNVPRVISASAAGRKKPRWSDSEDDDSKERAQSPPRARLASPSSLSKRKPSPPHTPPSPPSKANSPSKRSLLSLSKHSSPKKPNSPKRVLSLSKNSPKRPNLSLSKRPAPLSPSKTASSPSKVSPKSRLRARSFVTSSPAPVKKKRIHHL